MLRITNFDIITCHDNQKYCHTASPNRQPQGPVSIVSLVYSSVKILFKSETFVPKCCLGTKPLLHLNYDMMTK